MDNYIVSARKYRPSSFRSVVGQSSLTTTLKNAILNKRLAHAYLFCGPRGVGKTTCARIFAKTINCLHLTDEGEACNECESCKAFNEHLSFNIHELDAASNNSVEGIRSLIEQVRVPPQIGKYKVYIIDEVHMLSTSAFNAFLKTLEEPPSYAIFILATTEKHKILPTILSRCQIYDFNRISVDDISDYLAYVAKNENIEAETEALNVIARKSDGGMRDALSIFDQVSSYSEGHITYQSVINDLNVLDYEYYFRFTDSILSGKVGDCLLLLNELLNRGFDCLHIVDGYASFFRDLLVCKDPETVVLLEMGDIIKSKYLEFAKKCSTEFLYKAIDLTNRCDLDYRQSRNKRLLVELMLIKLCGLSSGKIGEEEEKPLPALPKEEKSHGKVSEPEKEPEPEKRKTSEVVDTQRKTEEQKTPLRSSSIPQEKFSNTVVRNLSRAPLSISIKKHDDGEMKNQKASASVSDAEKMASDFSQDELNAAWKEFADTKLSGEEIHLKNTMLNILPELKENYEIEIPVYNPEQKGKLDGYTATLVEYLRKRLKNDLIKMFVSLTDENKKNLAYTDLEKYKQMISQNPKLDDLSKKFDLRIY